MGEPVLKGGVVQLQGAGGVAQAGGAGHGVESGQHPGSCGRGVFERADVGDRLGASICGMDQEDEGSEVVGAQHAWARVFRGSLGGESERQAG